MTPLTPDQFAVLTGLADGTLSTVPDDRARIDALRQCRDAGYVADGGLTEAGRVVLEPHRVDNAIIMAAGMSQRFAPISYEKPKGLLKVRGEVLVERQIRQLRAAGITDITVVVGFKAEYFFFLRQAYGVNIVVNPYYATKDNHSSLWLAREKLGNTYICSADNYFTENPFERYVPEAYYSLVYSDGPTEEWCVTTDEDDVLTGVVIGGRDAWHMLGHVYFDRAFSTEFRRVLEDSYDLPQTAKKPWETLYIENIDRLRLKARRYPAGIINEFDSLDEVRLFDDTFIENVDSEALDNIAAVLGCEKNDITGFEPLKQGITNLSCSFLVNGGKYVYRHPGVGTEKLVNRQAELEGLQLARDLGLDSSFLAADPAKGWKISRFLPGARPIDLSEPADFRTAMEMCRQLHDSGATLSRVFDYIAEGLAFERMLAEHGPIDIAGYDELKERVFRLKAHADADGYALVPSHNDFFSANFLKDADGRISLIDWEYAGMSDPGNNLGTFAVNDELTFAQMEQALEYYFGRPATLAEKRHFLAHLVFAGWCWYLWALLKEAEGDNVGEYLFHYYRCAADNVDLILSWYEDGTDG